MSSEFHVFFTFSPRSSFCSIELYRSNQNHKYFRPVFTQSYHNSDKLTRFLIFYTIFNRNECKRMHVYLFVYLWRRLGTQLLLHITQNHDFPIFPAKFLVLPVFPGLPEMGEHPWVTIQYIVFSTLSFSLKSKQLSVLYPNV